jgi:hypothetical protein
MGVLMTALGPGAAFLLTGAMAAAAMVSLVVWAAWRRRPAA